MGLSQFKDKVEKTVTRKAATSSAHDRDDKEAQSRTRYNLRKRKGQEWKDSCPTNTNKKPRRNIQTENDEQKMVTNSRTFITRSKMGATKMTVSKEQASKTKSLKIPKWNQGKRISTQSLKRKNQSSMETIANRSKKAKTLKKKLQKSTSVSTRKAYSLLKKETKSSPKLGTTGKSNETKSSPKIGSARKRNEKESSPKLGNTKKSNETKSSPKLGTAGKRKTKPPPNLSTAGKGKRKEMKSSPKLGSTGKRKEMKSSAKLSTAGKEKRKEMKSSPKLGSAGKRKETKSSAKLSTAGKRKERISPKAKQENLRNKNPSTLKKRTRSSRVKEPIPEKGVQPKTLKKKFEGYKELPGEFANIFLNKLDLVAQINHGYNSPIHGITVTHDDLVWVNYLSKRVNLYNSSGDLLRFFDVDYPPVFNSCTSSGDLLVTQGYGIGAKPTLELISLEGNTRLLADLSTHTDLLCGILYQDEKIYVIGHGPDYFILKLDMNGEVEKVYETEPERVNVNHIISLNGQIVALNTQKFSLLLLDSDNISTEVINKVMVNRSYSASASVDNFGNVIVGTDPPDSRIVVVDPGLERKHEIVCGFSGRIRSTAVDHQNQLWIGTDDGKLYIAKYFR